MLQRVSLRWKLIAVVVAIFVVVQGTLSLVIVLYQRSITRAAFDQALSERLEVAIEELSNDAPPWTTDRLRRVALAQSQFLFFEGFELGVFKKDGSVVRSSVEKFSDAVSGEFARLAPRAIADPDRFIALSLKEPDGDVRLGCRSFKGSDGESYAVCLATSDSFVPRTVRSTVSVLLLAFPVSLTGVLIGAWLLSGFAVRPLASLGEAIEKVSPEHLSLPSSGNEPNSPEVKKLREKLDAALARLEEGYDAQSRFLANVSHEIKTPIAVLLTESQTMLSSSELDGEDAQEFAASVSDEMKRLGRLVESFLMLTRVREGKGRIQLRSSHINELIMDAVLACAGLAAEHDVSLSPHLIEDDDPAIRGEPDLLQSAIENLIRNAVRFSPHDQHIEIKGEVDGDDVLISVRDFGSGVPEEFMSRVFQRFSQASSEQARGRGTGLGLQIALGIAELHGGSLGVVNLDTGCRFTLRIPRNGAIETAEPHEDSEN